MKTTWNKSDSELAFNEGWNVFQCFGSDNGDWQLQRNDEANIFESDVEAIKHVVRKAFDGSKTHIKAIAFIRENNKTEFDFILAQTLK